MTDTLSQSQEDPAEREDDAAQLVPSGQYMTVKYAERAGAFPSSNCWPSTGVDDESHPSSWAFLCLKFKFGSRRTKSISQTENVALDKSKRKWGLSNFPRHGKASAERAFDFSPIGYHPFEDCASSVTDDETLSETSFSDHGISSGMSVSSASNTQSVCLSLPVLEEGVEEEEDEVQSTSKDTTSDISEEKDGNEADQYDTKKSATTARDRSVLSIPSKSRKAASNSPKKAKKLSTSPKKSEEETVPREDFNRVQNELQARLKVIVALKNVVINQRKSMSAIEKKNEMYKDKLAYCQKALATLQDRHLDHKSRIATLELEKEIFEAAAMWSKEEVKTVRSEMENLTKLKVTYEERIRNLKDELSSKENNCLTGSDEVPRKEEEPVSSPLSEPSVKEAIVETNVVAGVETENQGESTVNDADEKEKHLNELRGEITRLRQNGQSEVVTSKFHFNREDHMEKIASAYDEELKAILLKRRAEVLATNKDIAAYARGDFSLEKLMGVRIGRQSLDVHGYERDNFEAREDMPDQNPRTVDDAEQRIVRADSYPSPSNKSFSRSTTEPIIYCDEESSSNQSSLTCSISTRRSF